MNAQLCSYDVTTIRAATPMYLMSRKSQSAREAARSIVAHADVGDGQSALTLFHEMRDSDQSMRSS